MVEEEFLVCSLCLVLNKTVKCQHQKIRKTLLQRLHRTSSFAHFPEYRRSPQRNVSILRFICYLITPLADLFVHRQTPSCVSSHVRVWNLTIKMAEGSSGLNPIEFCNSTRNAHQTIRHAVHPCNDCDRGCFAPNNHRWSNPRSRRCHRGYWQDRYPKRKVYSR